MHPFHYTHFNNSAAVSYRMALNTIIMERLIFVLYSVMWTERNVGEI